MILIYVLLLSTSLSVTPFRSTFLKLRPFWDKYTEWPQIDLEPYTGNGFRDTGRISKLAYLGMKLAHWPIFSSTSCTGTYTLFLPQWVKIELILALQAAVSEIWWLPYLGMSLPEATHMLTKLSRHQNFTLFWRSYFEDNLAIFFIPYRPKC